MNILSLAALGAAAFLSITDPTGDAHGDGTLTPPTSPIYAHSAIFDLQELHLSSTPAPSAAGAAVKVPATTLSVTLGAVDHDASSPAGFAGVVVDVYLDFEAGGSETTLVGPGMLLPLGSGWDYAVRLSPAGAFGVAYREPEATTALAPAGQDEPPADDEAAVTDAAASEAASDAPAAGAADEEPATETADDPGPSSSGDLELEALTLQIDGNRLIVELPLAVTEDVKVYAVTGVYDPFASTSWRPLADTASPWAYSGGEQLVPVIDVLAVDQAAQTKALQTGALPQQLATGDRGIVWLALMGVGLLVAIAGLWFRRRVVPEARPGLPYGLPPDPEVVALDPEQEPEPIDAPSTPTEPETVTEPSTSEDTEAQVVAVASTLDEADEVAIPEVVSEPAAQEPEPSGAKPDGPNPESPNLKIENEKDSPDAFDLFGVQLDDDEDDDDDDFLGSGSNSSNDYD